MGAKGGRRLIGKIYRLHAYYCMSPKNISRILIQYIDARFIFLVVSSEHGIGV